MDQQQTNWVSLGITMLATINTALIAFGTYNFSNDQLQALNEIVSVVGSVVGVIMSHRK